MRLYFTLDITQSGKINEDTHQNKDTMTWNKMGCEACDKDFSTYSCECNYIQGIKHKGADKSCFFIYYIL